MFFFSKGNVTFSTNDDDTITVTNSHNNPLEQVSRLLEVDTSDLLAALSKRIIAANGEVLQKAHTLSQAEFGRDALAKVLHLLFSHVHLIYFIICLGNL